MKATFTLLFIACVLGSTAQRITYDTTIVGWNARVTYDPSADSSEGIMYFPGAGEVGTDVTKLRIYGPHYWMLQGWDGGVTLGNGTHYPIYVSLQPPSQSVLTGPNIKVRVDAILSRFKIKRKAFYLTGPSAGGFATWTFVTYQPTAGVHTGYGDLVTAIMCPESVKPNSQQGATPAYPQNTVDWIKTGKYALGFNQINDGGRDMSTYYTAMNTAAPGRATFYNTDFSGGTHCCFQEFWDPYTTTWNADATSLPVGLGIPNGWSTYQWLLRNGDTTLYTSTTPPANVAPTANAGSAKTITLPTSSVTLDGSGSTDSDGSISTYAWTQSSGPVTATIATPAGKTTSVTGLTTAGTYVFKLTVTDNSGATASATVTITVNAAANVAPTANAGSAKTITLPTSTSSVDGSGSTDSDGSISTYAWTQSSGPVTATIATPAAKTTNITGLTTAGTYTFKLTVTDNSGATASATVTITVSAAANVAPTANAGSAQTITLPTSSVTLDGSGSTDSDGSISTYAWTQSSGPVTATIATAAGKTTSVSGLTTAGTYVFKLTVTDNSGATASATVTITVNAAANVAPVANAGADQTVTLPTSGVTLDGSASYDPDGTISTYAWTQVSGPGGITITSANTAKPQIVSLTQGTYVFQLKVTDNGGASATDQVTIIVNAAAASTLTASAGSDTTIALSDAASGISLSGNGSADQGGTITGYSWTQVSGPSNASIATTSAAQTAVTGVQAGSYVFQLTVTDDKGNTATATVTIKVTDNMRSTDTWKLYPNPAHDLVNLSVSSSALGTTQITVSDMGGRTLIKKEIDKTDTDITVPINITALARGFYFVKIVISSSSKPSSGTVKKSMSLIKQ